MTVPRFRPERVPAPRLSTSTNWAEGLAPPCVALRVTAVGDTPSTGVGVTVKVATTYCVWTPVTLELIGTFAT